MSHPQEDMDPMDDPEVPITSLEASASLSLADVQPTVSNRTLDSASSAPDDMMMIQGESSTSFPAVEEIRATVNPERSGRSKRKIASFLLIALCVLVLVLGVSLGVGMGKAAGSKGGDGEDADSIRDIPYLPTDSETPPEDSNNDDEMERIEQTIIWLENQGIANRATLKNSGTPQFRAAKWIAEQDERALDVPTVAIDNLEDSDGYMFMFRYVMALLYFQTGGEDWHFQLNWLSKEDVCDWTGQKYGVSLYSDYEIGGVRCDEETKLPIELDLEMQNMKGPLPTELGLLDTLIVVDLEFNDGIDSAFPEAFCDLPNLGFLALRDNGLYGEIPPCIKNMEYLHILDVRDNLFKGNLPDEVCDLVYLRQITLDRNSFDGPLPDCIGKWTEMMVLSVSDNLFDGELPVDLSKMAQLQSMFMDGNSFSGDPIAILNELTSLQALMIEDNIFTGVIDENFLPDLKQLIIIDVSSNKFTASGAGLPQHLFELPYLKILDLADNQIATGFPEEIPVNDQMTFFSVHENLMTGRLPIQLTNLTVLQHLDLSNNEFRGPLHKEFFEMPSLRHIFISENPGLGEGIIPTELENMQQLTEISLKNSNRVGPLPNLLGFSELWILDLDNNDLSGMIPENYGRLPMLRHLLLNRNEKLTGELPDFSQAENLGTVVLDGTGLTGDFSTICELPTFQGQKNISTEVIMIADCAGESTITCDCCHCCDVDEPYCSDPLVASLDWTWEYGFFRAVRDFALNVSNLEGPLRPVGL